MGYQTSSTTALTAGRFHLLVNRALVIALCSGAITLAACFESFVAPDDETNPEDTATDLAIQPRGSVLGVGSSVQLWAVPMNSAGKPVPGHATRWESSDGNTITVDENGVVTGVSPGTATLSASSKKKEKPGKGRENAPGQLKKNKDVTVDPVPVASVEVSPSSGSVAVGSSIQFSATTYDADGNILEDRFVTWSSSNTGVAEVDQSGSVSGMSPGSATITATSEEQSGTASVTVSEPSAAVVDMAVWPTSVDLSGGQRVQLYSALLSDDGSVSCVPESPSLDPDVLFNGNVVAGCDSAAALLDRSLAGSLASSR